MYDPYDLPRAPCREVRQRAKTLSSSYSYYTRLVLYIPPTPMVRRIASQVHKQASRLTRAGFLKTPPVWYEAVLEHPPLPLPPREPPARTSYDSAPPKQTFATKKTPGPRPLAVNYIEDDIRRQFFRDHPFEAFRARSITEAGAIEDEHPINGLQWTRLNQRGRNPSPEEYVDVFLPPPSPPSLPT